MKHLAYRHAANVPLVVAMFRWIRQLVPVINTDPPIGAPRTSWRSRLLVALGWLLALIIQAALILVIREVITLCHGVIDLYLDLAKLQLDLSSQYVAVTSPPTK